MANRTFCRYRERVEQTNYYCKQRGFDFIIFFLGKFDLIYFELVGLVDGVEMGLNGQSFFQTLLEHSLESDNLLDISKEGVDLGRRKERFLLERLQVILQ